MKPASVTARPGRPPDPDIEPRVLNATLEIYAEVGWAGFTMDAVARRARVGKAALYRRWESREKLIVGALASLTTPVMTETTGSLREDLLAMCVRTLRAQQSRDGLVGLRAQIEAKFYPELFGQAMEDLGKQWRTMYRQFVLLAIDRGEIPQGTSPALVLDAVNGIVVNHVLSTPIDKMPALLEDAPRYAERVVDFVLSSIGYRPAGGAGATLDTDGTPT
ncbi:TetR/AcrR family transcriptional regulator [Nonomuraea sp. MCN248]|uniref:TetR/AcrR family transcriptional regulator n=1 Tax=Nonomuraea corallina TaxID=2989783 RepID=A0ABT4SLB8_9ACTN|nr:TetR/AcrR family transcriptional regulator [Nonomuraea corallina]MDA0637730.1 TetR/AcrR family transcriptional regulator [Nonomuraea corallina]